MYVHFIFFKIYNKFSGFHTNLALDLVDYFGNIFYVPQILMTQTNRILKIFNLRKVHFFNLSNLFTFIFQLKKHLSEQEHLSEQKHLN